LKKTDIPTERKKILPVCSRTGERVGYGRQSVARQKKMQLLIKEWDTRGTKTTEELK